MISHTCRHDRRIHTYLGTDYDTCQVLAQVHKAPAQAAHQEAPVPGFSFLAS